MKPRLPTNLVEAHLWRFVIQSDAKVQPVFRSNRNYHAHIVTLRRGRRILRRWLKYSRY